MVRALADAGLLDGARFDVQIELLRQANRMDCVAYLMEWHRKQAGASCSGEGGSAVGGFATASPYSGRVAGASGVWRLRPARRHECCAHVRNIRARCAFRDEPPGSLVYWHIEQPYVLIRRA